MWWRRPIEPETDGDELLRGIGTMVMGVDRKLDEIIELLLEDDDGRRPEEEED